MKNKYSIGLEIFFINIVLVAYVLTSEGSVLSNSIIAIASSILATIINLGCVIKAKNKKMDNIFLCLNIFVLVGCIVMLIINII